MGGVALFGMLAYLFTPLSAAGAEGAPEGFGINLRYAVPALLAGITLLPLATAGSAGAGVALTRALGALAVLVVVLLVTNRADAVLRDPDRLFAWAVALLFVLIPAALHLGALTRSPPGRVRRRLRRARRRPRWRSATRCSATTWAIASSTPARRPRSPARTSTPPTAGHGGVEDARIGLVGTTAGFLEYGFYGTDLSNRVRYLGVEGPHGAFNAIPTCAEFRAAVNAADLDYLVTAPLLNFIEPDEPVVSPEAGWLRGEPAVVPVDRSGPVTVWRVDGRLDPGACGPANAPLRRIPQQPSG